MFNNLRAFYQVMRGAKLPRSELDKVVHKRLKAVLVLAYRHVPYYRELMHGVGYDPVRVFRGPEDLSKLPITSKKDLKQRDITAFVREGSDLSKCFTDLTSGSTGIPLRIYREPSERALQTAKWLRVLFINGYSVRQKVMAITSPDRTTKRDSIIQQFGLLRRLTIDYVHHSIKEIVDIFLKYKPEVLYAHRSHLDLMALELKRRRIKPEDLNLKLLIGGSELIHESSRQLYRKQFGVELVEYYGSWEMGTMAYETPEHNGLHLNEDLTYFEFLDIDGNPVPPGRPGRVVVTDLTGKLMPFIRYDQGDQVVFEYGDDVNGNPIRKLSQIIGREDDFVLLPDGTQRSAFYLFKVIYKYEGIVQFRVVQRTRSSFDILIVADTSYFLSIRGELMQRLQQNFPPTVSFEIVQVDEILPDPTGKIRTLVSEAK